MNRYSHRFLYTGTLITLVLALGTAGFTLIEHYPVFDAFYMTLITITTVGYREVRDLSEAGRVFNCFVIIFGVTVMFFAIGAMTQTIIEMELGDIVEKRRNKKMIDKLKNHYIVCGYGRVGRNASLELKRSGVPMVVVDVNPERVTRATDAGLLATMADATRDQTLRDLGIAHAAGLISALATDANNLFVILSAKTLNPDLYVVTRAAEDEAEDKLRRAGADIVFAPYSIAGMRLAQALLRPHVFHFLDLATKSMGPSIGMEQVRVAENSEFVSRSLQQLQIRRDLGVIVLAIQRRNGEMLFNPPADASISGGDYLIVMGENEKLRVLEELLGAGSAKPRPR